MGLDVAGAAGKTVREKEKQRSMMEKPVHGSREMTRSEMESFLKKQLHGRLGLCAGGEPYVVPLSYGFVDGSIYFHSATKGKKIEYMRQNNRVCFQVDEWVEKWASVICYGRVTLRDDAEAKARCFSVLMGRELSEDQVKDAPVEIGVVEIEEMTGRCSEDFDFG